MRREQKPILPTPHDLQALAERFSATGAPRRYTLTPETSEIVRRALQFYADVIANPRVEANFTVDVWSAEGAVVENMARASGALVARAAFDQACRERVGFRVTLRQGIRLLETREARPGDLK
ncbi:hypothetical protein [Beijerinckia sp. L45]|uniref:hypothetical protein n=1 Tax=Beijerinckia sp. L45 TaxID=1641855 RepID=UPI00131EAD35|nr:hypothetical protein [Beijerinckia sp. L45]